MNQELVRLFAVAAAALPGLLLGASIASAQAISSDGFPGSVPKAICGPGDHTESGLQGQTTVEERFGGDSERAYNCNLELVGQEPQDEFEGAFSQDGPAYDGDCAYYGTDRVTSQQQHLGVTVIDASDPQHPRVSAYLNDSAAARAPHETVMTFVRRHLLVVGENNGPDFAVYDTSDCRHPALLADIQLPGSVGHMGAFAPDGRTYWETQGGSNRGFLYSVDLTDPSNPVMLPPAHFGDIGRAHEVQVNPMGFLPGVPGGTRLYAGQAGSAGDGPDGLVIMDVSDYQFRLPNPQVRIISTLFWPDQGTAEPMVPVKIKGHPYIISADEAGGAAGPGGLAGACARGQSLFGYPNIIDVSDETNPRIIAKLRLEVSDPAKCLQVANGTPPDPPGTTPGTNLPAASGTTNYSEERCVADNPNNAKMLACSFSNAGLRVFDVRDPQHAKEIAYWKPPAVRTKILPASGSWAPGVDRTVEKISGWARWVNGKGNGQGHGNGNETELQLWTVSDGNGFQILRFTDSFKARHKDLFQDAGG